MGRAPPLLTLTPTLSHHRERESDSRMRAPSSAAQARRPLPGEEVRMRGCALKRVALQGRGADPRALPVVALGPAFAGVTEKGSERFRGEMLFISAHPSGIHSWESGPSDELSDCSKPLIRSSFLAQERCISGSFLVTHPRRWEIWRASCCPSLSFMGPAYAGRGRSRKGLVSVGTASTRRSSAAAHEPVEGVQSAEVVEEVLHAPTEPLDAVD